MSKIAVFDIDGTVYREAMSFIVAEELLIGPDFKEEAELLDVARHTYKSRGSTEAYWTYNKTILDVFKKALRHTTPEQLERIIDNLLKHRSDYCYAYTTRLIKQLKEGDCILVAISGSIANIVEPFARSLGFDYVIASGLEVKNGKFTGERATETKLGKDKLLKDLELDKKGETYTATSIRPIFDDDHQEGLR